jgi:hypothetical protein
MRILSIVEIIQAEATCPCCHKRIKIMPKPRVQSIRADDLDAIATDVMNRHDNICGL